MKRIIIIISLIFMQLATSGVSYAIYSSSITSIPAQESGFSYSDGRGNSISINRTQAVPVIVDSYPNAVWVLMSDGGVPPNAIIQQYVNGYPVYFCKVLRDNQTYYGQLFPDQGCIIADGDNTLFSSYYVLSR